MYRPRMKPLMLAIALASVADLLLRHGQGMRAVFAGVAAVGHAVGGWVYYQG